jgi:MFS family permease
MLLFGVSLITLGSIATDLQAKFDLDAISKGTLFSILPFGILLGSVIFGPVCDRFGYKALLVAALVGMFAGFQGIAHAETLVLLQISVFIFGTGAGIVNGATNAVVADISDEHRGANLSLLGVFFGLGALGMPMVLGALTGRFSSFQTLAAVGWLTLAVAVGYLFVEFPPAKHREGIDAGGDRRRLLSPLLLLIAFFLFCQSSLEAIINNWTTSYVTARGFMSEEYALYALSLHIVGMVTMRLLTGSVFRQVSQITIMWACLVLLFVGVLLMQFGGTQILVTAGLVLSGAGLAGGFPVMLGFVGERFSSMSGTAFSFVFVIALIGNMLVNYLMGLIVHHHGVEQLTTVSYIETAVMAVLFVFIVRQLRSVSST